MASSQRISSLTSKHKELERQLHDELTHPCPDEVRLKEIKRQKLAVKDQLAALQQPEKVTSARGMSAESGQERR